MFASRGIQKTHRGDSSALPSQQGFTIIEVLIVLAIAGLIMVIVFLAVPALQRSNRNQDRKTDIKALLGSVDDFEGTNGAAIPSSQADIDKATSNMKFSYYKAANVFYNSSAPAGSPTISPVTTTPAAGILSAETINVYMGYSCTAGATSPPTAGTYKNVAVEFVLEQASGNGILQCLSS